MASGRKFSWVTADGRVLPLDRDLGYWILQGVTGLGKPIYENDLEPRANGDGTLHRGSRAATRQVFLPMEVYGSTRIEQLARMQVLGEMTNPKYGPGYLYITDGGKTYRLRSIYRNGMEGDEGREAAGEAGASDEERFWQRTGPVFEAVDPYFESPTLVVEEWGYSGAIPFFPIPPVRLNPEQVLSDIGQPVRNNFLPNPSFETNVTSWDTSVFGNPAVVLTRSVAYGVAPTTGTPGSWAGVAQFALTAVETGPSALTLASLVPGAQYTAHGWVYIPSTTSFSVRPGVFFNADGNLITEKDQWVWTAIPFLASGTTDRVMLTAEGGSPVGGYIGIDKWAVSEGIITSPEEYIDGDQLYCHWLGTAHASQSYSDPIYEPSVVVSEGTVESYGIWRIVGPGSILTLQNDRSGRLFQLNLPSPLGSGDVITVDTQNKIVYAGDDPAASLYQYVIKDDFWPLEAGRNTLRLALTEASIGSQIVLSYYPRLESLVS